METRMTKPEIRKNDEARMTNSEKDPSRRVSPFGFRHSSFVRISGFVIRACAVVICAWLVGCSDNSTATTKPTSLRERQDAALKDPYGYKPDIDNRDVSGGGLLDYDKQGMKKDLNNVFNP